MKPQHHNQGPKDGKRADNNAKDPYDWDTDVDALSNVVSMSECTGLVSTPPENLDEAQALNDIAGLRTDSLEQTVKKDNKPHRGGH